MDKLQNKKLPNEHTGETPDLLTALHCHASDHTSVPHMQPALGTD